MTPKEELESFIKKYSPEVAAVARAALAKMRKLTPGGVELVYDNYNALAIGFGATERASDAILSIALYPRWVSLFLLHGAIVPDPTKRLRGCGSRVRQVVLQSAADLDERAVRDLIAAALALADAPLDPKQRRRLVIKSVSPKQRERRPMR
jgi:hypothetical protein